MKVDFIVQLDYVYSVLIFLHFVIIPVVHVDTCLFIICCLLVFNLNTIRKEFQIQFQNKNNAHSIYAQRLRSPRRRLFWALNGRATNSFSVLRSFDISLFTKSSFVQIMNSFISLKLLYNPQHCLLVRRCCHAKTTLICSLSFYNKFGIKVDFD